jgi:signal transduction histidine kinase
MPDLVLTAAFAVLAEVELRTYHLPILAGTVSRGADTVLVLLPLIPLAWRRARPTAAVVVMPIFVTTVGIGGGTICFFATMLPFVLLMYAAAAWSPEPYHLVALGAPLLLLGPMTWYDSDFGPNDWLFGLAVALAAWLGGQGARRWRRQSQELAVALRAAEAGREALAELAVSEERTRIARELHDVVAHGVTVMVMQAGVARLDLRSDPDRADDALARIQDVGKAALAEMRRLLGMWRDDSGGPLEPAPGMTRLPALIDGLVSAGARLEHRTLGSPRPLSDLQDVSAYRVFGEALTNALRHGAPGVIDLQLDWQEAGLAITVSNPVVGDSQMAAGTSTPVRERVGQGLTGIRERAALFGGRCEARVVDGRYVTEIVMPYQDAGTWEIA